MHGERVAGLGFGNRVDDFHAGHCGQVRGLDFLVRRGILCLHQGARNLGLGRRQAETPFQVNVYAVKQRYVYLRPL